MVYYNLRIEKQRIFGADKISIAANANKTISIRFQFDESWRIYSSKAAIFKTADNRYYIIELIGSTVKIPWEVLTLDRDFELSVIAFDNKEVLTAGGVAVSVKKSLLPEDCKTLSPTETLFDKFKQESLTKAFEEYKNKMSEMERDYQKRLLDAGVELNKEKTNAQNIEIAKEEEIKRLSQEYKAEIVSLKSVIQSLEIELDGVQEKADNWDLINTALSQKTQASDALWYGGTKEYKLPMLNTKSISNFGNSSFDSFVSEIGLDCTSIKIFDNTFKDNTGLKKISLRNTNNISSMEYAFSSCASLREADIGIPQSCNSTKHMFSNCKSLEKVTIGSTSSVLNYSYMFSGCTALKEIRGNLDLLVSTTLTDTFSNCTSLEYIRFVENSITTSIDLGSCKSLTADSMDSLFNGLSTVRGMAISVSKYAFDNNYTQAEQAAIVENATTKGWTFNIL